MWLGLGPALTFRPALTLGREGPFGPVALSVGGARLLAIA